MKIIATGHPGIRVRDMETSVKFYEEVLGMKVAFRMNNPDGNLGAVYMYIAPSQFVELLPNGKTEGSITKETIGVAHICYEVEDAKKAEEELIEKGVPIDRKLVVGYSKCLRMFIHDPDGNSIEIMQLMPGSLQAQANKRLADQT